MMKRRLREYGADDADSPAAIIRGGGMPGYAGMASPVLPSPESGPVHRLRWTPVPDALETPEPRAQVGDPAKVLLPMRALLQSSLKPDESSNVCTNSACMGARAHLSCASTVT